MTIEQLMELAVEYGQLLGEPIADIVHFLEWVSSVKENPDA